MWNSYVKQPFETYSGKQPCETVMWNSHVKQLMCNMLIWNSHVKQSYETATWNSYVKQPFETAIWNSHCETALWNQPCETALWNSLVKQPLWNSLVKQSCETALWNSHMKQWYETVMWNSYVKQPCETSIRWRRSNIHIYSEPVNYGILEDDWGDESTTPLTGWPQFWTPVNHVNHSIWPLPSLQRE